MPPVRELSLEDLALQPSSLPDREVGILHGELGERRVSAGREGFIEGSQLAVHHGDRPAIECDMVSDQEQHVIEVS